MLRNQLVSAASFDCSARDVQRAISEALDGTGLEPLGLAHLHPPHAFLCHSSTDDEWISEKLAPQLAALPRYERRWSRAIVPAHDGAGSVITLDDAGLVRVRCPDVELATAVVEAVQTHDRVFSVVFQVDHGWLRFYALELAFTHDPVPVEGGEVRLLSSVTAAEPVVVVETTEPEPLDLGRIDEEVRRYVSTYWGGRGHDEENDDLDDGWSPPQPHRGSPRAHRPARPLPAGAPTPRLLERALVDVRRALENGEPAVVRERLTTIAELITETARLVRSPGRTSQRGSS